MLKILDSKDSIDEFLSVLEVRGSVDDSEYLDTVLSILKDVKTNGDEALLKYTQKFDNKDITLDNLVVRQEELKEAYDSLSPRLKEVINTSKQRIYDYHAHQVRESFLYEEKKGEVLGQRITPLNKVGVYVPGGKAAYPSSVIMNVMPARVAGVKEIIMVSPTTNQLVLATAYVCGVDKVIRIGGAQAIAALAYGTNTVSKVDKIVGPGNIFVTLAKKTVFGLVGIDSVAGPSEILVIADDTANPKFVAADLLGQAEHDELASSILITTSKELALNVNLEVKKYFDNSIRKNILEKSINDFCRIIIVSNMKEAAAYANFIAPEHLEICMDDYNEVFNDITNAGAIFLGHYSPEALGDYMAGPNHVLPTVKTAKFFSPLSVDDFIKKSSVINFSKEALLNIGDLVVDFAFEEGLQMHGLSVLDRIK